MFKNKIYNALKKSIFSITPNEAFEYCYLEELFFINCENL